MIISDAHRFVFVHIPKCAGTSVRRSLAPFGDGDPEGRFAERVAEHDAIGLLDFTHIQLHVLRDHFAAEFSKLIAYESYAVIRDPMSRFASALSQRVKMYRGGSIASLTRPELREEVDAVERYLSSSFYAICPDFVHFARQIDYLDLDGARIVDHVYALENIQALEADISERIGTPLPSFGHDNRSWGYRWVGMGPVMRKASRTAQVMLSPHAVVALRRAVGPLMKVPSDDTMIDLLAHPELRSFIEDYYAQDFAVYRSLAAA